MNLQPLYEVKTRLEQAAIAGTGLLSEDFRLQRAGEELNLPVLELLSREGVLMQHEMAASFRKKGGRPVFRPLPGAERKAAGRRILLVDDIVTTGGTVQVCAAQLQKAGAEAVVVLAAAAG